MKDDQYSQKDNLLYSMWISFNWLNVCKSEDYPLRNQLQEYESHAGGPIINAGTLIAYAYMVLVFAKESKMLNKFVLTHTNIKDFGIELDAQSSATDKAKFINRLRNSISHARIFIEEQSIVLEDGNYDKNKREYMTDFRVKIPTAKFGNFLNKILTMWNTEKKIEQIEKNP
jgi:hypothetical protein